MIKGKIVRKEQGVKKMSSRENESILLPNEDQQRAAWVKTTRRERLKSAPRLRLKKQKFLKICSERFRVKYTLPKNTPKVSHSRTGNAFL